MTIETNITNRRELAGALAQYMNTRAVYLGPPTFAYQIGDIHLSREGILSGDDLDGIFPFLEMQGIVAAQPKQIQEPVASTASGIQIPLKGYTPVNLRNLFSMLYSKQWLIRKACCMSALHILERAVNSMPIDGMALCICGLAVHELLHVINGDGANITWPEIGEKVLLEIALIVGKGLGAYLPDFVKVIPFPRAGFEEVFLWRLGRT